MRKFNFEKFEELRKARKMSYMDVSRQANVSKQAIHNWKRQIYEPDIRSIVSVAELFNVPIDELYTKNELYTESEETSEVLQDLRDAGVAHVNATENVTIEDLRAVVEAAKKIQKVLEDEQYNEGGEK